MPLFIYYMDSLTYTSRKKARKHMGKFAEKLYQLKTMKGKTLELLSLFPNNWLQNNSIHIWGGLHLIHLDRPYTTRYEAYICRWMVLLNRACQNEYPTMHYFEIPRHTQSMIAYSFLTEYFWKFQWKIALWECCEHAPLIITFLQTEPCSSWRQSRSKSSEFSPVSRYS